MEMTNETETMPSPGAGDAAVAPAQPEATPVADYYYSPGTGGFYLPGLHASLPGDAVGISAALHAELMAGQIGGGRIESGPDGLPVLTQSPPVDRAALRAAAVSAECRRRIYAEASTEAQINMATAAAVIGAKAISSRSAAERAVLDGVNAALAWVAQMRATYAALAADPAADYLADTAWPPLDEAVRTMIADNF